MLFCIHYNDIDSIKLNGIHFVVPCCACPFSCTSTLLNNEIEVPRNALTQSPKTIQVLEKLVTDRNIRLHASPIVEQDKVSGEVSVLCWHAAPVANVLWKLRAKR